MLPRLSGLRMLDFALDPPAPSIGLIAIDVDWSNHPMTSRNDSTDSIENVRKHS